MDDLSSDLRHLATNYGEDGYKALKLLHTIVLNIFDHPEEVKYRTISARKPAFFQALSFNEFFTTLIMLGFTKKVVQFEEKWTLHSVGPVSLAKMQDLLVTMTNFLRTYEPKRQQPVDKVDINDIRRQQQEHNEYIARVKREAEEDRQEKLRREEITIRQVRAQQQQKAEEEASAKRLFRQRFNLLDKPSKRGGGEFDNRD